MALVCMRQQSVECQQIPLRFCHHPLPHFTKGDVSPEVRGFMLSSKHNYWVNVNGNCWHISIIIISHPLVFIDASVSSWLQHYMRWSYQFNSYCSNISGVSWSVAGRLMKVGKVFYLLTMSGHLFPDRPVFTMGLSLYCNNWLTK